jgi:RNA polymerase sigma-70 factor (ECF subfamily)
MDLREQQALEQEIRSRFDRSDFAGAATAAIRGYGPQILGLLVALHRNEEDATEVFSIFTEHLWAGLARFSWESSFRTWAYTLARHASYHYKKKARRRAAKDVPLSDCPALSAAEAQVRTATLTYLRTQPKNKLAALRETLPEHDQILLILRIDKRLAWDDLARVMLGAEQPSTPETLKKESARLRKRFQLVKEHLRELCKREGLVV